MILSGRARIAEADKPQMLIGDDLAVLGGVIYGANDNTDVLYIGDKNVSADDTLSAGFELWPMGRFVIQEVFGLGAGETINLHDLWIASQTADTALRWILRVA